MERVSYQVQIWGVQGPRDLARPTTDEVREALCAGLRVLFEREAASVAMLKDDPARIARQGEAIGARLERAMWLSVACVDVQEV